MLQRLKTLQAEFLRLVWLKFAVTFLGYFFAIVVQIVPPTELANLPQDTSPQDLASIKIGGFAFIVAISLFALLIPTGDDPRDKFVDGTARLLGVIAAPGAAWHTLDASTQGNPGLYLVGIGTLTGLAILMLLVGGGIWAVILLAARAIAAALDAAILCLLTVAKHATRLFARTPILVAGAAWAAWSQGTSGTSTPCCGPGPVPGQWPGLNVPSRAFRRAVSHFHLSAMLPAPPRRLRG